MEWLGNESYAYIPFEAPPEVQEQLTQLEKDLDGESMRTQLVISLDGASKVAEGDEAEIYVNSAHMHLFDPATGENLTLDTSAAGRVPGGDAMAQAEEVAEEQDEVAASEPAEESASPQRGSRLRRSSSGIGRRLTVTAPMSATPFTRTVGEPGPSCASTLSRAWSKSPMMPTPSTDTLVLAFT